MDPPPPRDADGPVMSAQVEAAPSSAALTAMTKRRRTTGAPLECCRTCRLRKVKCTGNPGNGPCTNCARLELSCSFVNAEVVSDTSDKVSRTTPSASHTEAGTLRKRAQRACNQCHLHKTKCSGDLPRCKRCDASGLPCEYTPAKRKFTNVRFQDGDDAPSRTPAATPATSEEHAVDATHLIKSGYQLFLADPLILNAEQMLLKRDFLLRHMDVYMEYLYYIPCLGFMHPKVVYQEIQCMTFHPAKAAALCSVTSFFVNPGEQGRDFGLKCANQVDLFMLQEIDRLSEDAFFLTAVNTLFHLFHGKYAKVWSCFGILTRLMIGLRMNWGDQTGNRSFIEQEVIRRLVWQVFSMDRLLAGGYDEYIACSAEHIKVQLPCVESAFLEDRPVTTDRLHDTPSKDLSSLGLHGWQMRITDLRHRIQVNAKKLLSTNPTTIEPSKVMADINSLQNELSRLHLSFPPDLRLNEQSLRAYMAAPDRLGYVWLHNHVGVAHIDLYRFSLPGFRDTSIELLRRLPREFILQSQRQAVAHALSVARFINGVRVNSERTPSTLGVKLIGDYSITHMSTQSLRVLLVALEHELYHDLSFSTTAPPWANARVDRAEIVALIDSMAKATEGWSHIFEITEKGYDCNKAMVEDFYRTRRFVERTYELPTDARNDGGLLLPGLEVRLEATSTGNASPGERWQHSSRDLRSPNGSASPYSPSSSAFEENYAPGIPMLLEQARGSSVDIGDSGSAYDADNAFTGRAWSLKDLNGMLGDEQSAPLRYSMSRGSVPLDQSNHFTQQHQRIHPVTKQSADIAMAVDNYLEQLPGGSGDGNQQYMPQ